MSINYLIFNCVIKVHNKESFGIFRHKGASWVLFLPYLWVNQWQQGMAICLLCFPNLCIHSLGVDM